MAVVIGVATTRSPQRIICDRNMVSSVTDGKGAALPAQRHAPSSPQVRRQQQELLELSTPVVKLWEGILALPLAALDQDDSSRTSDGR
jgi:rsbT co-antagonist protein RsbR